MKIKRFFIILFGVAITVVSFSGCTSKRYDDISNFLPSLSLLTPEGEYKSIAWLDENRIAYIYRPQNLVANGLNQDFRLGIFELSSGKSEDLPLPDLPPQCSPKSSGISELAKVPDGSLGFIYSCASAGSTLYLLEPIQKSLRSGILTLVFLQKISAFHRICPNSFKRMAAAVV